MEGVNVSREWKALELALQVEVNPVAVPQPYLLRRGAHATLSQVIAQPIDATDSTSDSNSHLIARLSVAGTSISSGDSASDSLIALSVR